MSGESERPADQFESEPNQFADETSDQDREEILDSLLEQTQSDLNKAGIFNKLVSFVRDERLPSKFSLENLSELVRFILSGTRINELPIDSEECIDWVTNCIYDDPVANERAAVLWNQIIDELQATQ